MNLSNYLSNIETIANSYCNCAKLKDEMPLCKLNCSLCNGQPNICKRNAVFVTEMPVLKTNCSFCNPLAV